MASSKTAPKRAMIYIVTYTDEKKQVLGGDLKQPGQQLIQNLQKKWDELDSKIQDVHTQLACVLNALTTANKCWGLNQPYVEQEEWEFDNTKFSKSHVVQWCHHLKYLDSIVKHTVWNAEEFAWIAAATDVGLEDEVPPSWIEYKSALTAVEYYQEVFEFVQGIWEGDNGGDYGEDWQRPRTLLEWCDDLIELDAQIDVLAQEQAPIAFSLFWMGWNYETNDWLGSRHPIWKRILGLRKQNKLVPEFPASFKSKREVSFPRLIMWRNPSQLDPRDRRKRKQRTLSDYQLEYWNHEQLLDRII